MVENLTWKIEKHVDLDQLLWKKRGNIKTKKIEIILELRIGVGRGKIIVRGRKKCRQQENRKRV